MPLATLNMWGQCISHIEQIPAVTLYEWGQSFTTVAHIFSANNAIKLACKCCNILSIFLYTLCDAISTNSVYEKSLISNQMLWN